MAHLLAYAPAIRVKNYRSAPAHPQLFRMLILDYLQSNLAALLAASGLLGLAVGSFLNVVIHRLPMMMERDWARECRALLQLEETPTDDAPLSLWRPRSRCPNCARQVAALENIPVLSYLVLRGRCAGCGWSIPWRYPAVELLTGLLSLLVVWHFGYGWSAVGGLLLLWASIALCFIDIDHQLLPDAITLPWLWLGLLFNYFGVFCSLHDAVLGAIAGYSVLWLVFQAFRLATGKEGMGFGDFKLLALLGAWQGWQMLPAIILMSSFIGAVVGIALIAFHGRERSQPIPFGPYLACAGAVTMLFGHELNELYLGI